MKKAKNLIAKTGKLLLVFGFVFSQLSFPLSVLADELTNNTNNEDSEEILTINTTDGEITDEQNEITNQTEESDSEEGELSNEESDFTVETLENEEQNLYIIRNNKINETLTVKQLKEKDTNVTVITDAEGNEIVDETTTITSQYQITITTTTEEETSSKTYTVIMLGDYNADGMITVEDKEALLELLETVLEEETTENDSTEETSSYDLLLVDLNKDEKFDILDVTHPIFTEGTWENETVVTDQLENYLMSSVEEVYLEDEEEIQVNYFVEGFTIDSLVGIQGKLNYDETLLELIKIKVNGVEQNIEELINNNFIYLLEEYNQDGILITFTFKALATGTPIVTIENIVASIGGVAANLDVEKVSTTFNVLEYGKGGDEETETTTPSTEETIVVVPTTPTYVALSTDNDIKVLNIEGYDIDFNPNTYEYSIKVKNDVTSLNISVLLNSDKSIYYVEGNENFEVGENLVYVVVKAENGSTKTYTIRVEKEKAEVIKDKDVKDDEEVKEEKNASKTVIIILIVLVIIGLIYVIFKDDEEDKKESLKENKTEKKSEVKKEETKPVKKEEIKTTKKEETKPTKKTENKKTKKSNKNNNKKGSKKQ